MGDDLFDILRQIPALPGYVLTAAQGLRWGVDRYRKWQRTHRPPPAAELLERRVRIRAEIEERLQSEPQDRNNPRAGRVFEEIIVHDITRMDVYPKMSGEPGIHPWLKFEVNGFYHRGLEVFLSNTRRVGPIAGEYGGLEGWRFLQDDEEWPEAMYAMTIGRIPFHFIERIDWARDEFYGAPHFYCRYAGPLGGPYEEIVYKAVLYPTVSRTLHTLEGLKDKSASWGPLRRGLFLLNGQCRRLVWRLRGSPSL